MADSVTGAVIPCRPSDVEPEGRLRGSGFAERQWLIRRGQQFIQVDELLYRVVELIDGVRDVARIARELTATTAWEITSEDVGLIIEARLVPLGLAVDDAVASPPRSARPVSPLLASVRLRVLGPRAIDRLARVLQHLYRPGAVAVAIVAIAVAQSWLFSRGHPSSAVQHVIATPLALPLIAALLAVAGVFHESGHAAALRYGGARARAMGVGFYLFVPIFYTDVTESYRLGRYARVRTDLGGLYFHLLAGTVFIGVGALTGNEFLLVAAFLIDLDVARQLIPFIRLDGYWALADLTGIPDLLTHAGARVRRQLTKKQSGPVPPPLRPGVRRVLIGYVAVAVPVIVAVMGYAAWHAPSIFTRTVAALSAHFELVSATIRLGEWGTALLAILEMILLVLPSLGLLFFFMVLARGLTRVLSLAPASPAAAAGAPPSGLAATAGGPAPPQRPRTRAGDGISFEAAIADHLELKRRHREPGSGSSRESRGHLRALAET